MSLLYENILRLCENAGVSPSRMCVDLGISKNIMSRLKNNDEAQLSFSTAKKIADYFKVDVESVLHGKKKSPASEEAGLSEKKKRLIDSIMGMTDEQIDLFQALVDQVKGNK